MIWKPNVTVAAVIEKNDKYFLVEEEPVPGTGLLLNQPAGHLDPGESLVQGVIRETLEETAYTFVPEYLVGVYQWHSKHVDTTYIRFAFFGSVTQHDLDRVLDDGIVRAAWFSFDEVLQQIDRHRSPLVLQCILDYRNGKRFPLDVIKHYD